MHEQENIPPPEQNEILFPISLKLITMIFTIVLFSLLAVTIFATFFFRNDNRLKAMEDTLNYSNLIAKKINTDLISIAEKGKLTAVTLHDESGANTGIFTEMLFLSDPDMIFTAVLEKGKTLPLNYIHNSIYFRTRGIATDTFPVIKAEYDSIARSFTGEIVVFNPSYYFNEPVIGISFPYSSASDGIETIILIFYSMDKILESIKTDGIINSFIVSGDGDIIAHIDPDLVKSKTNISSSPVIMTMMSNPNPNAQISFNDENGERFLGAFSRAGFSDTAVVSIVNENAAFAMVYKIQRIIMWITGVVLSVSFIANLFFSRSLSVPITKLTRASKEIQHGHYDVDISSSSKDEIGLLTNSFKNMARGLAEKEKIKSAFGKFVNKQIADLALNNEINLGGEKKDVAVFFSDIRSFTSISESLDPEDVVNFLNEYMTRMVNCIHKNNGVVDKYIGDAIMAVWGAPISTGDDSYNAVSSALMMRDELIDFNKGRGTRDKPVIHMGCGIHYGQVLSGQIGCDEKMEYTVIGDTVNIASRVEAVNKAFGTDILITDVTASKLNGSFLLQPMQKVKVKGKTEILQLYAVLGRKGDPGSPENIEELRLIIGTDEYFRNKSENPAHAAVK